MDTEIPPALAKSQASIRVWLVVQVPSGSRLAGKPSRSIHRLMIQRVRPNTSPMASRPTMTGLAGVFMWCPRCGVVMSVLKRLSGKFSGDSYGFLFGWDSLEIFGPGGVPMYQSHKPEAGVPPDGTPPLWAALALKAVANLGVFDLVTHSIGSVLSSLRSLRQALQINFSLSFERTLT